MNFASFFLLDRTVLIPIKLWYLALVVHNQHLNIGSVELEGDRYVHENIQLQNIDID